jgi:hypothetical protein
VGDRSNIIEWNRVTTGRHSSAALSRDAQVNCSFCAKYNKRIIAGPDVFICEECVSQCGKIFARRKHYTGLPRLKHSWTILVKISALLRRSRMRKTVQ